MDKQTEDWIEENKKFYSQSEGEPFNNDYYIKKSDIEAYLKDKVNMPVELLSAIQESLELLQGYEDNPKILELVKNERAEVQAMLSTIEDK